MIRSLAVLVTLLLASGAAAQVTVTTITPEFNASGGVAVGPDGNAYVADFGATLPGNGGNTIYRIQPDGTQSIFATGFIGASGNAFDAEGNIYQSNIGGGRVSKVTPEGVVTTYASVGIAAPVGVAVDSDGNVYNTNCQSPGRISKTTPSGVTTTLATSSLMSCPNGLTIDDEGNLYTANFNNGGVVKITPGGDVSLLATVNTSAGNGHLTFANGRLYVCNWSGRIYELMLDGSFRVLAGTGVLGTADGPADEATFYRPNGISATASGDTLFINQSTRVVGGTQLHPNVVRMITGLNPTVGAEDTPEASGGLGLAPSVPNPLRDSARIGYRLPTAGHATLRVYSTLGQTIRTLVDDRHIAGEHTIAWDGLDDAGLRVASGVYVYGLELAASGGERLRTSRSMLLVR